MTQSNGTGTLTKTSKKEGTVSRKAAMTIREKERIEDLLKNRAKGLHGYLSQIKGLVFQVNDSVESTTKEDTHKLTMAQEALKIEEANLRGRKTSEYATIKTSLERERDIKLRRLERLQRKVNEEYLTLMTTADEQIEEKYAKAVESISERRVELERQKEELASKDTQDRLARRITLAVGFSRLEDNIGDAQNRAVERLWTEDVQPGDATDILAELPDTSVFREHVSPGHLFKVFDEQRKNLTEASLSCPKCENAVLQEYGRGDLYCAKCGTHIQARDQFQGILNLPTLQDIVSDTTKVTPRRIEVTEPEQLAEAQEVTITTAE